MVSRNVATLPSLNVATGTAGDLTDLIMEDVMKDQGRKRKIAERAKEKEDNNNFVNELANMGRISSAKLAAANHYQMDSAVKDAMVANAEKKQSEERQADQKRKELQQALAQRVSEALSREASNLPLSIDNLKALVQSEKREGDSPMRSKKAELIQQLQRRRDRRAAESLAIPAIPDLDAAAENFRNAKEI